MKCLHTMTNHQQNDRFKNNAKYNKRKYPRRQQPHDELKNNISAIKATASKISESPHHDAKAHWQTA